MSDATAALSAVAELGYQLIESGQLAAARALWQALAAEQGKLAAPWRALAFVALRDGRPHDALAAAAAAHERDPGSVGPLVLRAEAHLAIGQRSDAARDLDAAIALPPRDDADRRALAHARALRRR